DEEGYATHFQEQGFVVVGGVLSEDAVDATLCEIWESPSLLAGHEGLSRDDPATWDVATWPAGCRNFLDPLDPCAESQSWRNRVNPVLNRVFDVLWQATSESESSEAAKEPRDEASRLVVSVDRFGLMRPTRLRRPAAAATASGAGDTFEDKPHWRTSRNWLHWDQNPWSTPEFNAMQGFVSLSGGSSSSGGFVTVPGFHGQFSRWGQEHPEGSIPKRKASMLPFVVPLEDEMQ
ncbi:unnamed protein product, partial [Polarella glacialis]